MSEPIYMDEGEIRPKRIYCLPGGIEVDFATSQVTINVCVEKSTIINVICSFFKDESMIDQDVIDCAETYSMEIKCDGPFPHYMLPGLSVLRGTFNQKPATVKHDVEKNHSYDGEEAQLPLKNNINICKLLSTEEDDSDR